jgi:hypothetical protein
VNRASGPDAIDEPEEVRVKLHVGQTRLGGAIRRYAERFDLVELRVEPARLPRRARLREWAEQAPEDFAFALAPGPSVFASTGIEEAMAYVATVAEILEPAWWVLRTPASVTPAPASVRRLRELIDRLPRGPRIAWEPSGPWDPAGAVRTAVSLGVHLVRDGSREALPDGDVVYTRLRALGEGANVGLAAADRLAEALEGREEAFVVVEGSGAARVANVLREALLQEEAGEEDA